MIHKTWGARPLLYRFLVITAFPFIGDVELLLDDPELYYCFQLFL